MNLTSLSFLTVFLPAVLLVYWLLPRGRNSLLLIVSLLFCAFGSLTGAALMAALSLITWGIGKFAQRKTALFLGVALNLGFLLFFRTLPGANTLAVPLGVSYFTFKGISYLADQHREPKENRLADYLLYVSFFPQITAGPLSRFGDFAPQLGNRTFSLERTADGFRRFLFGLGKKMLLAVPMAQYADQAFGAKNLSSGSAWLGAAAFLMQIYFDFSGYSDMAIGLGQMFGFRTPENFDHPYLAHSLTDFWRRWHITLSAWIRDYIYIPLGGSRKGKLRSAFNKLVAFTLCGLWHGISWNYLLWGLWHGVLCGAETLMPKRKPSLWNRAVTLLAVMLGFVIFRAEQPWTYFAAMFGGGSFVLWPDLRFLVTMAVCILLCFPVGKRLQRFPLLLDGFALVILILSLFSIAAGGFQPFLYAAF